MKLLRTIFDKTEPLFEKPLFKPFKCIFDATDAFFFAPGHVTEEDVHIRDALDIKRYMSIVIVAAAPAVLASLYFFGPRVLGMLIVSYAVGGLVAAVRGAADAVVGDQDPALDHGAGFVVPEDRRAVGAGGLGAPWSRLGV